MVEKRRTQVLCVDDEPNVLEGLALNLRRRYDVLTATSGAAGLQILERERATAVVVSDMRMPNMDGAAFLAKARAALPEAVRLLLTGEADLNSAISAVNDGQIFRFLTKPCPPPTLLAAIDAAAEQHRLITAERVLLEQTLHGSIKALTDVLSLTNPVSFGRATRIKQLVIDMGAKLEMRDRWQVEVAAMLSQLGFITLPAETIERVYYGQALSEAEQKMVAKVPEVTEQLLGNIPRLEAVREILSLHAKAHRRNPASLDAAQQSVERAAQVLRVAVEYDALEAQGNTSGLAVDTMRGRLDRYDPDVLDALAQVRAAGTSRDEVRELPLSGLRVGMVIADDVKMTSGSLLIARGYEVTAGFLERARNFRPGTVKEPLRVIVRASATR
jgi:response regulator RpfG family c-di-GMP phosphodiesterase